MPFLADGGRSTDIWNRLAADHGTVHQTPVSGQINHLYVRIRNRGTTSAQNVRASAFQTAHPATALWPRDWQPLSTPQVTAQGPIPSGGDTIVGPLTWTPTGPGEGVLVVAEANGDRSNMHTIQVDINTWLLVLLDNNITLRVF